MANAKSTRSGTDPSALVGAAFSHRELLVLAAVVKLAERADFKPPERAALKRVFAKLEKGHLWQAQQPKTAKKRKAP